ncbi:MAG TPA: hypothetical protein VF190_11730 [Rhodothermales bacterium]
MLRRLIPERIVLVPGYVIYWPRTRKEWGFYRDAKGRVIGLGKVTIYPKGY